jgi:uncharacterized membrane protein YgdD (TMEM256/DUF423 family)
MVKENSEKLTKYQQFRHKMSVFHANLLANQDYVALKGMLGDIILSGLLIVLSISPFYSFSLLTALGGIVTLGSGFWFLKNQALPELIKLLTSISLVRISK